VLIQEWHILYWSIRSDTRISELCVLLPTRVPNCMQNDAVHLVPQQN